MIAPAVNFHLFKPCNAKCRFCFATFRDVDGRLSTPDALKLIAALRDAGIAKINFVGGEPTLHPDIGRLVAGAWNAGFVTSIVTNGYRLSKLLDQHAHALDWVGLSVDSGSEQVQAALGRGTGDHVSRAIAHAAHCRDFKIRVKLNTVVTSLTWNEDLSKLVRLIQPERWKVFQVLPIDGQNDGSVEDLLIDARQFETFLHRHRVLAKEGFAPIAEDNDAMQGSYMMIDPLGRFFGNSTGRHVTSEPILRLGVARALKQVGFVQSKFDARGGVYPW